jgi:hypothetical protein
LDINPAAKVTFEAPKTLLVEDVETREHTNRMNFSQTKYIK